MRIIDMNNNETVSTGIFKDAFGFTALTLSATKTFKTYKGAIAWLAARGYNADGSRK